MSEFNRGLSDEFVEALNEEYSKKDSWWQPFVDDDELLLAIRERYVNVYYGGGSVLKLCRLKDQFKGEIHHKYLCKKEPRRGYYVSVDEKKLASLCIAALKARAKEYQRQEKRDVHCIIDANQEYILDVEIAFPKHRSRIDFSMLKKTKRGWEVKFYEAKVAHNGDLRANGDPKVLSQMDAYAKLLEDSRKALAKSYRKVVCNLTRLEGVADRHPKRHSRLCRAVSEELVIDTKPSLVITRTVSNRNWPMHLDKLRRKLEDRVICLGESGWKIP